jgi:hypothetical protein
MEVEMDKLMIDGMAQVTRRDDRFEPGNRCRRWTNAALFIGALPLLIGGVDRPGTIVAQQVARQEGDAGASRSLAEARIKVARKALNSIKQRESRGSGLVYNDVLIHQWSHRLLAAQFDMCGGYTERVSIFEAHLGRMKELEERVKAHYIKGMVADLAQLNAVFHRLEAEAWLARVKQGQAPWTIEVDPLKLDS